MTAIKGYVVRHTVCDGTYSCPCASLVDALAEWREVVALGALSIDIFRVHDDGREEKLPSYEEALGEIERLKGDATLAADPQVLRYATMRASEAERVNWLLQGLADKVTAAAAADVDLPAPLREAIDALGKAERYERVPPVITRAIPTKDAEDVRRIGFELLTCALCWDPKARLVGNLTAAQIADAAVGAMVAGGLSADEAHLSRIRVVETLLRDGDTALREASVYADDGEPIAERVRALAADRDALRPSGADPLAALEAAERRLLEAGGWRQIEPDAYGGEQWQHPKHGREGRMVALTIARKVGVK